MSKTLKYSALALGIMLASSTLALAHDHHHGDKDKKCDDPPTAPEVDPSLAISGLTLLGGALVVLRSRRRTA